MNTSVRDGGCCDCREGESSPFGLIRNGSSKRLPKFDDERKLMRTFFVGNLSLKIHRKNLSNELGKFGGIDSVRILFVLVIDVSSLTFNKLPKPLQNLLLSGMKLL